MRTDGSCSATGSALFTIFLAPRVGAAGNLTARRSEAYSGSGLAAPVLPPLDVQRLLLLAADQLD